MPSRPIRSIPVEAMDRTQSAKRISGAASERTQISVYSERRHSSAGNDRMQSPIAPGRINRRRKAELFHRRGGFKQRAVHILNAHMNGFRGFQVLFLDFEARCQHAIDRGMRRNLVFDG